MRAAPLLFVGLCAASLLAPEGHGEAAAGGMVTVGPGVYRPVYPPSPEEEEILVPAFRLDVRAVTNGEFLEFVEQHPRWQKGGASALFVDADYLGHWEAPLGLGEGVSAAAPVTRVSWFAARAYCAARGARIPGEVEWELAAAADESRRDARSDPAFRQRLLDWYSRPTTPQLPPAGLGAPNAWGIRDLHGLIWEWVLDFNGSLVSSDNREDGGADSLRFCGAAALAANDKDDYAAFMRSAFRSSLEASYTTANLGFRCATGLDAVDDEARSPESP